MNNQGGILEYIHGLGSWFEYFFHMQHCDGRHRNNVNSDLALLLPAGEFVLSSCMGWFLCFGCEDWNSCAGVWQHYEILPIVVESFLIKIRYCHYCRCNVRSIVCCTSTCHFVYLQGLSVAMRGFRVYLSLGAKKFREYYTYANAVLALDCKN